MCTVGPQKSEVMLGISFFSLKILCDNISVFQMETDRGFMLIIVLTLMLLRFVSSLFYPC